MKFYSLFIKGTWRKMLYMLCILSCCSATAFAQTQVSGNVVDVDGKAIIGVNVVEKGTTNGVTTDVSGNFTINVRGGNSVLQASYVGYATQEITVGNRTEVNITLLDDTQALDEVVVVGYGTQKKANLSGAVASISSKALENRPLANANLALQGLAPGMNIDIRSGQANAAPSINIRGMTSINGGSAFILVDNVPVSAEELARMNPSDIESVSILQDAASAAIYGARAAYGVVLITTKTAKSDKLQIDFDASYSIRRLQPMVETLNEPYVFMTSINEAIYPNAPRYSPAQVAYAKQKMEDPSLPEIIQHPDFPDRWDYYASSDWADLLYRKTSPTYNANLRVSQKTGKLTYDLSGSYYQQDGMLDVGNDIFKRYNVRGKGTYQLTDRWSVGSNISFATSDYDVPTLVGNSLDSKLTACRTLYPVYNPDGTYTSMGADTYGLLLEGGRTNTQMNEMQVSFNTTIDILKDVWSIKGDANFRRANTATDKYAFGTRYIEGPNLSMSWRGESDPYDRATTNINNYTVLNAYTDFHKTFGGKHFVQALAGFNQEYLYINNYWVEKRGLFTNSLPTFNLANGTPDQAQDIKELALRGLFFRANYIFDNRYILEFNGRRDGTSRYPTNSRWGFFPSGSAAWVVSQEKFFSGIAETLRISNLKFRGSYGELGNQVNDNYYPFYSTMGAATIGTRLDGDPPMGVSQPDVVAPGDLTWERVRTINGGIDLSLFDNRFDLTANIYTRYTEGMLTGGKDLPGQYGVRAPTANAADLKTKGWELALGYRDRVNAGGSPLSYGVRFMLWDSRAWITKFDNLTGRLNNYREGQELGEIWGLHTAGFFASDEEAKAWADQSAIVGHILEAGDLKFEDINHDGRINNGNDTFDDSGDRTIIGNNTPRYRYSFEGNAEWKGFDLRIFLHGVGKRDFYITNRYEGSTEISPRQFYSLYDSEWLNPSTVILDRWTPENPDGYFPKLRAGAGEVKTSQTKYLQDASWMRIKNVTIGYTLPKSLTDKWKIDRLRVYLSGENLWTLNHIHAKWIDPEVLADEYYPVQKVFSIGINLNF
jgi:TonB-linked SusC/RagA family outer membrane protein